MEAHQGRKEFVEDRNEECRVDQFSTNDADDNTFIWRTRPVDSLRGRW